MENVCVFDIRQLLPIALTIVVAAIGVSYGLEVMGDIKDDMTAGSAERNATVDTITGVAKITAKLPMIATIVVAAVIIGILLRYLVARA